MMAIARGITLEQMAASPGVITIISVNSPRRFDEAMCDGSDGYGAARTAGGDHAVHADGRDGAGDRSPRRWRSRMRRRCSASCSRKRCAREHRSCTARSPPMSTCDRAHPRSARRRTPRRTSPSGQLARRYRLPYRTSNASASNAADAQGAYETRNVALGRDLGTRQPHLPCGRLAGRRTHRFLREVGPRRGDAADDDRVPEAHRRR